MRQNGQVAIVVLLISAIVMTVGLSVSKRTVVETKIDKDEEQLKQAFNTAESGIEYYLKTSQTTYTASDLSSASVSTEAVGVGRTINLGGIVLDNETQLYWLVGHNDDGTINYNAFYEGTVIDVCVNNNFAGALKIDYFYRNGGNYSVWRNGYNVANNNMVNGYTRVDPGASNCIPGMKAVNIDTIPLSGNTPLLLAVRLIGWPSTNLVLRGDTDFPSQGENITSTGKVGNGVSQVVKVFNRYRVPVYMIDDITAYSVE